MVSEIELDGNGMRNFLHKFMHINASAVTVGSRVWVKPTHNQGLRVTFCELHYSGSADKNLRE